MVEQVSEGTDNEIELWFEFFILWGELKTREKNRDMREFSSTLREMGRI